MEMLDQERVEERGFWKEDGVEICRGVERRWEEVSGNGSRGVKKEVEGRKGRRKKSNEKKTGKRRVWRRGSKMSLGGGGYYAPCSLLLPLWLAQPRQEEIRHEPW